MGFIFSLLLGVAGGGIVLGLFYWLADVYDNWQLRKLGLK